MVLVQQWVVSQKQVHPLSSLRSICTQTNWKKRKLDCQKQQCPCPLVTPCIAVVEILIGSERERLIMPSKT
jgi:hypothetical protein